MTFSRLSSVKKIVENWRFKDSYQQSAGAILPSDVVEAISVPR